MGFIFGGDTKLTYQQLQRNRELAKQMLSRRGGTPRNVGEGLNAIGDALLYRSLTNKANKREGELQSALGKQWGALFPGAGAQQPQMQAGLAPQMGGAGMGGASYDAQDPRNEAARNSQRNNPVLQGDIAQYANGIASVESAGSGDYSAVGPATKNGSKAYGRYQVMDFNIPAWTKKHVGRSMTPQEFLADPAAQDAVFNGEFGASVQKYGNPQDAASVWFSGQPQKGNNASDGYNTVPQYLKKFNAALGQQPAPQQAQQAQQPQAQSGPSVQQLIAVMGNPMANPAQRQYASTLLQQRMQANQPMSEMDNLKLQEERLKLEQMKNPQAANRRIVKGQDGRQYYADTQEPVLPNVNAPEAGSQIFSGKSVEAQALNQLVEMGNLSKSQALEIAAGKTVTGKDGEIIFLTPSGIFAKDPRNGLVTPVGQQPAATPAPAPATPQGVAPDAMQQSPDIMHLQPGMQQPSPMDYGPQLTPQTPQVGQPQAPVMQPPAQAPEGYGQGAIQLTPKKRLKLSDAESKSVGFYERSKNSHGLLNKLEDQGLSFKGKALNAVPFGMGNFAQTEEYQKYDQARRDFVNAILRRESGAVINPEEFKNADIQYFPQPGDGPEVIAQKRRNRELAVQGLLVSTGRYGQELQQKNAQPAAPNQRDPLGLFSQ